MGDDFTVPTGPKQDVTFLGRSAYHVELAPPDDKALPLQIVFDAETGFILREGNDASGSFHEWVDLAADLPDELFDLRHDDRAGQRYR